MFKKKTKVEFYDTAEDMPIKRWQRFNKYLMIDNEVGITIEDYDARTLKAGELLKKGMINEAIDELENRRQMVYQALSEYSPKHYALALLVKSIDGEPVTGMNEPALDKVLAKLNEGGYSERELSNDVFAVKKKLTTNSKCISRINLKTATRRIITLFSFGKWTQNSTK